MAHRGQCRGWEGQGGVVGLVLLDDGPPHGMDGALHATCDRPGMDMSLGTWCHHPGMDMAMCHHTGMDMSLGMWCHHPGMDLSSWATCHHP